MAKTTTAEKSTEQLTSALNASRKIQLATMIIFAVIILAWVVSGSWRQNIPVFISTVAMAVALYAAQTAARGALVAELKKRGALSSD